VAHTFIAKRPDGIPDEPRADRPRTVGDAEIERVIVWTLESTRRDATHWRVRSMGKASGRTPRTIHRIWARGIPQETRPFVYVSFHSAVKYRYGAQ
jgi:hypothetical protein